MDAVNVAGQFKLDIRRSKKPFRLPTTSRFITEQQKKEVRDIIQPGDLLLETNNECPWWQWMTKLFFNANWTHNAIYMGKEEVAQAESGFPMMTHNKLEDFLNSYHVAVLRPHYKTDADKNAALQYLSGTEGRPYDTAFDTNDDSKLYCSEVPYHAFLKMEHPIKLPLRRILGKDIVSPIAGLNNPDFDLLWSSRSNFWKNQLSHYPLGIGMLAGAGGLAVLGDRIGHPIALAAAGAMVGTAAAYGLMKLIWPSLDLQKMKQSQ